MIFKKELIKLRLQIQVYAETLIVKNSSISLYQLK